MYYQVNPESIIFLRTDCENGYTTVAYDWTSDNLFLIRPPEYKLLKFISDNQPVESGSLMESLSEDDEKQTLETILDTFVQKKILFSNE